MDQSEESQLSSAARQNLSVIASFPVLLSQEEQMVKTPFHVAKWCLYLTDIDELLEEFQTLIQKQLKHNKRHTLGGREELAYHDLPLVQRQILQVRWFVAERAVTLLPGSYKLWRRHLTFWIDMRRMERLKAVRHAAAAAGGSTKNKQRLVLERAFERALMRLHKMPRVWLDYLEWFQRVSTNITEIRRLYNRALEALPVTQHDKIWKPYLEFLQQGLTTSAADDSVPSVDQVATSETILEIPDETILRVMRRHAQYFDPTARERLAQVCQELQRYGEAALLLLELLNDHARPTKATRHDLWMTLAQICTHHPTEIQRVGIDFEALVRGALQPAATASSGWTILEEQGDDDGPEQKKEDSTVVLQRQLGEMEGTLWAKLADYYIRLGEFDMGRSVYEEALEHVSRVRDFSILFDAYVKLEEGVIEAMMELANEVDEVESHDTQEGSDGTDDWDILAGDAVTQAAGSAATDIELALARAEHLTSRRPLLLNRVLLRQNPHNVGEWTTRCELYQKLQQPEMAAAALEEALGKVQAHKAVNGMPSQLVLKLAPLYERDNVDKARGLFGRICEEHSYLFRDVDDLAQCYAAWVELEIRQESWDNALSIARRAVAPPDPSLRGAVARLAKGLPKSLRLWDLLLDLEESLGTVATTKDSYNRAIELKVATPMHIINFASFLTDHKYFEESFTAYERGVELFAFPHPGAKLLWKTYLLAFLDRFGGSKMERARDLFERCVEACPPEESSEFFLMNGKFEQEHGLTKRALRVYRAMCQKVPPKEKYTAYQLLIAKTTQFMGVPATRDIYQEAISTLEDSPAAKMCLDFCRMETSLQEIERARAVLTYGSQMADPRRDPEYWKAWHEFEVSHGNEETFREMLRVKRSVQAAFSTVNYNAAEMSSGSKVENLTDQEALSMLADREGVDVKSQTRVEGFVHGKRSAGLAQLEDVEDRVAKLRKATTATTEGGQEGEAEEHGDDEIDLDELDEDDEGGEEAVGVISDVNTKSVPAGVFGGLTDEKTAVDSADTSGLGARERLRAATDPSGSDLQ